MSPGTEQSVANTLNRVTLKIDNDGKFELSDCSLPFSGKLDPYADHQDLKVELVAGKEVGSEGAPGLPVDYRIVVHRDRSIELSGGPSRSSVLLFPLPKP